jgi:CDP-2,3-bis-(O-geranylgeranyl)-sn-glycerol synthase
VTEVLHETLIFQLLMLLAVANGSPVAAKLILGDRYAQPLDGGVVLRGGMPLFGQSKTLRGILLAVIATAIASVLLGLDWKIGALVGGLAMAGDLFSSFIKRRLGMEPSSRSTGLDQVPEALFPLISCQIFLPLSYLDIAIAVLLFLVGGMVLSRILFAFKLRDRPY